MKVGNDDDDAMELQHPMYFMHDNRECTTGLQANVQASVLLLGTLFGVNTLEKMCKLNYMA